MNQFIFSGRLCRDADISISGDMKIAKFGFAVDRRHKSEGQPTADFFNLTAFYKTADFIDTYCRQGTKLLIEGHIANNNYQKNGKTVYQNSFIVDSCEFCEKKSEAPKENFETPADDFADVPEDLDLPFD